MGSVDEANPNSRGQESEIRAGWGVWGTDETERSQVGASRPTLQRTLLALGGRFGIIGLVLTPFGGSRRESCPRRSASLNSACATARRTRWVRSTTRTPSRT